MPGQKIAEGKTKIIQALPPMVRISSKDDITAGDGAKHDILEGKAALSTKTTSNVFQLLQACGMNVAFCYQDSPTSFIAEKCDMLPLEVVVRREAHGSYLKRHPSVKRGTRFEKLVVEFYLKTEDRRFGNHQLLCDDPLMVLSGETVLLFDPKEPEESAVPFRTIRQSEIFWRIMEEFDTSVSGADFAREAAHAFVVLEHAWYALRMRLVDFKVEFGTVGVADDPNILLADVIDNDSWRLLNADGSYLDKQVYRDGGDVASVLENYRQVAAWSENLPAFADDINQLCSRSAPPSVVHSYQR